VHRRNPLSTKGSCFTILNPKAFDRLRIIDWEVVNADGGLHWRQIVLYR
jgi:hypothetical protein